MTAGGEGRTDPRERFSGAARGYARFRPGYPDTLVDRVLSEAGVKSRDPVADLGCGTGILTRMLAARGLEVVGIDPNRNMLEEARSAGGGAEYRGGDAKSTGLADQSVALVTVAQAFHWFDVDAVLGELRRVLNPQGHVAAIWNIRGENAFMDAYDALLRRFSSEYKVLESWETTLAELKHHARVVDARELRAEHAQRFDLEGLQGRAWSSSYVFRGVEDREGFDEALASLFHGHALDGTIEFPYRCVGLVFRIRASEP
jgi:ubiquinone/menaquinone biosynthesis C-methylase UbiE